jgi:hypothetical protein
MTLCIPVPASCSLGRSLENEVSELGFFFWRELNIEIEKKEGVKKVD